MVEKRGVRLLASALFLFVALSCCCSAAEVFNKYILPSDTAKVQGNTFTFTLSPDWQKLYFSGNGTQSIIAALNCKDITFYTICFNGTRYNVSKGWGTADRFNGEVPQIYVRIYDRAPAITITRRIDNSSLLLGEETTIHVEIKNTGNVDLYNVVYRDDLPKQLQILAFPKMAMESNKLTWEGGIDAGRNRSLYYDVKTIAPLDVQSKAKVVYEYANKSKEVESSALRIRVIEPLTTTAGIKKNNLSIYENATFYVNFVNTDPVYPVNITALRIYLPKDLLVKSYSSDISKLSDNSYRWRKGLVRNAKTAITINVSSAYYGIFPIRADLKYITHNTEFNKNISVNLTYYSSKLTPIFWLKSAKVRAGEENEIEIGLKNSNKKISFEDIRCSFESRLMATGVSRSYPTIGADTEINLFSLNFTPPYSEAARNYSFSADCNYKSLNSQQFFTSGIYNITAKAAIGVAKKTNSTQNGSTIKFGSFLNASTTVTRQTTTTSAARTATTTAKATTTTTQKAAGQQQATGILGFFAKIGHFVRGLFG